jgi:hypothetical protein
MLAIRKVSTFPDLTSTRSVWQDKQQCDKDTSICTSTAYEGCETPFIFHMFSIDVEAILDGSKSQLLPVHYSLVGCPSEVPRILNSR